MPGRIGIQSVALVVHAVTHVGQRYMFPVFAGSAVTINSVSKTLVGSSVHNGTCVVHTDTENVYGFQNIKEKVKSRINNCYHYIAFD